MCPSLRYLQRHSLSALDWRLLPPAHRPDQVVDLRGPQPCRAETCWRVTSISSRHHLDKFPRRSRCGHWLRRSNKLHTQDSHFISTLPGECGENDNLYNRHTFNDKFDETFPGDRLYWNVRSPFLCWVRNIGPNSILMPVMVSSLRCWRHFFCKSFSNFCSFIGSLSGILFCWICSMLWYKVRTVRRGACSTILQNTSGSLNVTPFTAKCSNLTNIILCTNIRLLREKYFGKMKCRNVTHLGNTEGREQETLHTVRERETKLLHSLDSSPVSTLDRLECQFHCS